MPRRTAHSKKGSTRLAKKVVEEDEIEGEQDSPSPSGKSSRSKEEGERSRRSSTAAQTAASVAESRVTRTRTGRQDSSPSDSRRSSGRDAEVPAARVRSSRRSAGRVNYKESDGEEESSTPKNEENFESNDEFEDSDSDERSHPKSKRGVKVPAKGRVAPKPKKGKGRGSSRGRPAKRKNVEEEDDDEEEQKPIDVSDDDDDDTSTKKTKAQSQDDKAEVLEIAKSEPVGKRGRKSSRGAPRPTKSESPVSRRPSRNKQVKKYTEVDEDFDEEEEAAEVKSEVEKKSDQDKKGTYRKRKREADIEPSKRTKKEHKSVEILDEEDDTVDTLKDSKAEQKLSEEKDADSSSEPMDVDESLSDSEPEKPEKLKKPDEKHSTVKDAKETADKPTTSGDTGSTGKDDSHPLKPNHVQNSDPQKVSSLSEIAKGVSLSAEKKDNTPGVIKSVEKETAAVQERNLDGKHAAKPENTFLSKGQSSDLSVNGEGDKPREPPLADKGFLFQNSSAPRANGEPEHISFSQKPLMHSDREYISNKSLGVDFVRGLKGNSVRFGFASYNLSSVASPKEKLAHALDKDVSIVCLQNVSKSLFRDTLESYFEANGFKAVVNWLSDRENHLVTFYKTSVFKVKKADETTVQKLIQKKLESSNLEENEKSAISECLDRCGDVLFAHLDFGHEEKASLTVANVKIPTSAAGFHALQLMCLNQELAELSEQSSTRVLLCGEFNASDTEIPYQLLRHGRSIDEILADFQSETDSVQNAAILKLLKNIAHRPSVKLSSCYALVLGRELTIPESKTTSPDLLWVSADGIHTVGIVDLPVNYRERLSQGQVPLKADIAVTLPFPPKAPV